MQMNEFESGLVENVTGRPLHVFYKHEVPKMTTHSRVNMLMETLLHKYTSGNMLVTCHPWAQLVRPSGPLKGPLSLSFAK